MTKTRVLLALAGLAAALAIPAAASAQAARTVTVNLQPQGGSGVAGTAILTDIGGGRTRVDVRVSTGGNATMPDHIHDGTCANLVATPKYPLNNVTNGTSTSDVNVGLDELLRGPYAVNLHKSPAESSVYVACGNIVAGAAALPATGSRGGAAPVAPVLGGLSALLAGAAALVARRRVV
jgi:hypothetical protein